MKQISWTQKALNPATSPGPINITIGVFDGLHRGHQFLIHSLRDEIQAPGGTGVITFQPNPGVVIQPERFPGNLLTPRLKKRYLEAIAFIYVMPKNVIKMVKLSWLLQNYLIFPKLSGKNIFLTPSS